MQSHCTGGGVFYDFNRRCQGGGLVRTHHNERTATDAGGFDDSLGDAQTAEHDSRGAEMELAFDMEAAGREQHGAAKSVGLQRYRGYAIDGALKQRGVIATGRLHGEHSLHPRNRLSGLVACIGEINGNRPLDRSCGAALDRDQKSSDGDAGYSAYGAAGTEHIVGCTGLLGFEVGIMGFYRTIDSFRPRGYGCQPES